MNKFILNFTPTGMIPTKEMTQHVPVSPDEIIQQVLEVLPLGINMVHVHARDLNTGAPTYKKEIYSQIIEGIKNETKDLIICVSTSGRTFESFEERSECLELEGELRPDFASLTLSSLNFNKVASISSPEMIKSLAKKMLDKNIRPELEAFDLGMINYANYLIRKDLIKPPYYFNLILGNIACAQADMKQLGLMVSELPDNAIWSTAGIGDAQLKMNVISIVSGGGVRIGLEDNIWLDDKRTILATNYTLVERIVKVAESIGYTPYTIEETRHVLQLD
jgi:uncharacterized protein (DUF849 family)